jgi:hypothetical protein
VPPELWAARVGPGHATPFHCGCCQVTPLPQSTVGERGGAGLSVSRSCAFTGRRPGSHWRPPRELSGVCASSLLRAGAYAVAASDVLAHTMLYTIRRLTPSMPWWLGSEGGGLRALMGAVMYVRREANTWPLRQSGDAAAPSFATGLAVRLTGLRKRATVVLEGWARPFLGRNHLHVRSASLL